MVRAGPEDGGGAREGRSGEELGVEEGESRGSEESGGLKGHGGERFCTANPDARNHQQALCIFDSNSQPRGSGCACEAETERSCTRNPKP
eukprot:3428132-Rhodomonas_salina.1